jgi:hypothetical protein
MFVKKDYREAGAGPLLSYIGRENHELQNRRGERMSGEEIEEFVAKSENHQYQEQWIISPEHGENLSEEELSLAARKTMSQHTENRPTAGYCYAVHRDTDHPHVQVAMTGEKADLWTDENDLDRVRENAREQFREREHEREREREQERENELLRENDLGRDRGHSRSRSFALVGIPLLIAALVAPLVSGIVLQAGPEDWLAVALLGVIAVAFYLFYRWLKGRYTTWKMKRIAKKGEDYPIPVKIERRHPHLSIPLTPFDVPRMTQATKLPKTGSLFVIGESGSGKTEAIKLVAYQMMISAMVGDREIVLDVKGDWEKFYPEERTTILGVDGSNRTPNLFLEPERPGDWDEIAPILFTGTDSDDDFFDTGARQVFAAVCKHIAAEFEADDEIPTNADLVEFVRSHDRKELYDVLSEADAGYPAATAALDPDSGGQAPGVFASFQQQMTRVFKDNFAEAGDFSISGYMADPAGETLILRLDPKRSQAAKPMFSFFVSWAIRHALSGDDRSSYFVLDEFARIPQISNMEDLMNVGRGQNAQAILGIQSTSQVVDTYGRDRGRSLLDGLTQGIIKRVNANTVDDARGLISRRWEGSQEPVYDDAGERVGTTIEYSEEHPFSENQLTSLPVDRAIVIRDRGWVKGRIPLLEDCVGRLNKVHGFDPPAGVDLPAQRTPEADAEPPSKRDGERDERDKEPAKPEARDD